MDNLKRMEDALKNYRDISRELVDELKKDPEFFNLLKSGTEYPFEDDLRVVEKDVDRWVGQVLENAERIREKRLKRQPFERSVEDVIFTPNGEIHVDSVNVGSVGPVIGVGRSVVNLQTFPMGKHGQMFLVNAERVPHKALTRIRFTQHIKNGGQREIMVEIPAQKKKQPHGGFEVEYTVTYFSEFPR